MIRISLIIPHLEPVCLDVLRDKNGHLANRENLDMFGYAKFVGLHFWISRFSRFRKGNFPLWFRYRDSTNIFCWKPKIASGLVPILSPYCCASSPLPSPYIYPQSSASTHQFHKDWFSLLCFCSAPCIVILHCNSK